MANEIRPMSAEEKKVIFASSLGTVFEWYDFYLYGSLAAIIAKQFFIFYLSDGLRLAPPHRARATIVFICIHCSATIFFSRFLPDAEYGVALDNLVKGMFWSAEQLYDIKFTENTGKVPVWQEDIRTFEVTNAKSGDVVGLFYLDTAGTYTFGMNHDDGARLVIDGVPVRVPAAPA